MVGVEADAEVDQIVAYRRSTMDDPEQAAIWKTVQILLNKVIYADGYLDQ